MAKMVKIAAKEDIDRMILFLHRLRTPKLKRIIETRTGMWLLKKYIGMWIKIKSKKWISI